MHVKEFSSFAWVLLTLAAMEHGLQGQNLIANGDFELGNTGFTSDYVYSTLGTSNLGECSIVSDPKLSQSASSSFGDHTSGTGLMLHANGSPNTNLVAWLESVSQRFYRVLIIRR
jgi:hypothetical protein